VIESGTWLERFAFFTVGYSSARVVDQRKPPPPQVSQESPESAALGRQEAMREHFMAQSAGLLPREGAGWEALKKFWEEQEKAAAKAKSQADDFVKSLTEQAATLGMTTEQAKLYQAAQLGISGAQMEAVRAAVATIGQYRTEEEQLKNLEAQASAERAAQERAEAALKTRAEREIVEMQGRLARLELENLTELELVQRQLDEKSALLNAAYAKRLIDEEKFESESARIVKNYAKAKTDIESRELQARLAGAATAFGNLATLMGSHNRKLFEAGKVAAIAMTLINTFEAAWNAYKEGSRISIYVGAAYAAAATIAGMMQVHKIQSTSFGSGGDASPVYTAIPGTSVPSEPTGGSQAGPPTLPQAAAPPTQVNLTLVGVENKPNYTYDEVVNGLIPVLKQAGANGAMDINVIFT
jgi:hypothetical protein